VYPDRGGRPERVTGLLAAAGVGYEDIGRMLGLTISTVKIRVHRARLKLGTALAASGRLG
jgi:DNA-directed RNA polymerase specialized sigma24 family protein